MHDSFICTVLEIVVVALFQAQKLRQTVGPETCACASSLIHRNVIRLDDTAEGRNSHITVCAAVATL